MSDSFCQFLWALLEDQAKLNASYFNNGVLHFSLHQYQYEKRLGLPYLIRKLILQGWQD